VTKFVSYVPDEAIEKDAQTLLAEYAHARGVTIEAPIAIDDVIEKHLKIGIEFDDTHRLFSVPCSGIGFDPDILGAIFFEQKMAREPFFEDIVKCQLNKRSERSPTGPCSKRAISISPASCVAPATSW
jgi:hypothetical protein